MQQECINAIDYIENNHVTRIEHDQTYVMIIFILHL